MARRKYRMTPKRKAALRKAQMASARKRRRSNTAWGIAGGVTVGVAAAGAIGYFGHQYIRRTAGGGPRAKSKAVVHVPGLGHGTTSTAAQRHAMAGGTGIVPFGNPGHEISLQIHSRKLAARNRRAAVKRTAQRNKKVFRQRMTYRKKHNPIPKVNRFTRQEARRRKKK